jgi:hypothetical protein
MEKNMIKGSTTRMLVPAAGLAALMLTAPQSAVAADPVPSYPGCVDFNITISATGGNQATRVTRLRNGIIYSVVGGHGTTLTIGNATTGKSVTFPTNGSVTHTAATSPPETGTTEVQLTGDNVLVQFPTDPGGPTTILYTGRITYTVLTATNDQIGFLTTTAGRQRDICAELAP